MNKKKIKKPKYPRGCRKNRGCTRTSWEILKGGTFETGPVITRKAA